MTTHTCLPIIPSLHPPHLPRFSRPPLSNTLFVPLFFSLFVSLSLLPSSFLSSITSTPPTNLHLTLPSFSLLTHRSSLSLRFSSRSFFLFPRFVSSLLPHISSCHLSSPFIRYFFKAFQLYSVTVDFAPSNSALPTIFFLSLLHYAFFHPLFSLPLLYLPSSSSSSLPPSVCLSFAHQSTNWSVSYISVQKTHAIFYLRLPNTERNRFQ